MYNCDDCKNNIVDFLENKLSFDAERKFIYHIDDCKKCFENVLEEYIFYVSYNDLDDNIGLNYRDSLYDIINQKKENILIKDVDKNRMYIKFSLVILFLITCIVIISIKIIYR